MYLLSNINSILHIIGYFNLKLDVCLSLVDTCNLLLLSDLCG